MARALQKGTRKFRKPPEPKASTKGPAMILRAVFILILTACYVFGETEENVNQQVDVGSGGNLVVDVSFGSVDIDAAGGDKVSIQAHREIDMRNEASEKQFLDEAPVLISKDGNTVRLTARRKD